RPFGTPYSPLDTRPALTQSLAGVCFSQLLTWSIAPLAAEVALLCPRALITAAPRVWHCGRNVSARHLRSPMTFSAGWPLSFAFCQSTHCVALWLPQIVTQVTDSLATPAFFASAATARLWSRRVIAVQRSAGMSRPLRCAMRQFVLHGLPTMRIRTSFAALAASALPCT